MRKSFLVTSLLLLLAAPSFAQHNKGWMAGESEEAYTARLQQESDVAMRAYSGKQSSYESRLATETPRVNSEIDRLTGSRADLVNQTTIVNNVTSYRKKDELAKQVEDLRKKYDAENGPRIRIYNPYDMSSYERYYDESGNLVVSEVRNSYELLEQQREDWTKARNRAEDAVDQLTKEYDSLTTEYGTVVAIQSELASALAEAERRRDQIDPDGPGGTPPDGGGRWGDVLR